jgi:SAM-dependent methyltransferase
MKDAAYWDSRAKGFLAHAHRGIWRDFSDELNQRLILRFLEVTHAKRILKTDLFDEALISGLFEPMSRLASEVHGIDISPIVVENACRQYPAGQFKTASITTLPYPDAHFETVISLSTLDQLETFDEIRQALSEIHRVLTPSGRLLITFDNLANPLIALRNKLGVFPVPYFMGQSIYPSQLEPLLRGAGFAVESQFDYMHPIRPFAIRICRLFENGKRRRSVLDRLHRFEALANWPTHSWTANYCGALARRI